MAAGPETVAGTQVSGSTNITGGSENINGAVAASKDDIADINAATQNALTLPDAYKESLGKSGFWGKISGGKTTDGGF